MLFLSPTHSFSSSCPFIHPSLKSKAQSHLFSLIPSSHHARSLRSCRRVNTPWDPVPPEKCFLAAGWKACGTDLKSGAICYLIGWYAELSVDFSYRGEKTGGDNGTVSATSGAAGARWRYIYMKIWSGVEVFVTVPIYKGKKIFKCVFTKILSFVNPSITSRSYIVQNSLLPVFCSLKSNWAADLFILKVPNYYYYYCY